MSYLDHTNLRQFVSNFKKYIISRINGKAEAVHTHSASEITSGTFDASKIPNLDASKITTGVIDIDRLPQGALERLVTVANQSARFALTTANVQLGDTVKQTDTGMMYIVTDTANLANDNGYTEYTAGSATSVPWSGVTGKPTFANVATSGSYNDLTDKPTIPTVPTNYVTTDTTQTVSGQKTWTAPQTFTETISGSINGIATRAVGDEDGNNIKSALAGKQPSLSQTQLDACNSGVTASAVQQISTNASNISSLQTAVSGKAADADVVHLAGAETITGDKTWTRNNTFISPNTNFGFKSTTAEAGSLTASSNWIYWRDKNGFQDAYISRDVWSDGSDSLRIAIASKRANGAPSTAGAEVDCGFRLNIHANGNTSIDPFDNGGTNLGTSTNKWKTLNGINPGALGMPNNSAYIDILSSITHTDWIVNYYKPAINGYIALNINGCAIIQPYGTYGISAGFYDGTVRINDLRVCLPVVANQTYEIWVLGTVNEARLFACLGNV